jgi:hypothetical protein
MAGMTGSLASINASGANTVTSTGNAFNINVAGTAQLMHALTIADASTGALGTTAGTSGAVVFNFSGAHTGWGFDINDATATGVTTQTTVNSLTTGTAFGITSTATGITSAAANTGSLFDITESGAMAGMTGSLASINASGANTVTSTGNALNINVAGTAQLMHALTITDASTGAPANGMVRFNFTGIRTAAGNGFQIDDASTTLATVMAINGNSLTTGNALNISGNALSSGSLVNIASNSTGAASNTQTLLNLALSGTNGTSSQTTYAIQASNTHTGSGTNVGLYSTASGGSNNYAAIFNAGNVGIGTTNPLELLSLGTVGTNGVLSLAGNTSGKIIIQPAAAAGTYTLTLPTTAGIASQYLQTDGTGVLSWATGVTGATGATGDRYSTASGDIFSIGVTGSTGCFTVDAGLAYSTGQSIIIANDNNNKMIADITSYNSVTGNICYEVTSYFGSGSFSSWSVNMNGAPGPAGPIGATGVGATGATGSTGVTGGAGTTIYQPYGIVVDSLSEVTGYNIPFAMTSKTITIDTIKIILTRTGLSTPSVTPKLFYGTNISAAGTAIVTSPSAVTSYSTVTYVTSFNNGTIPPLNMIWLNFSAVGTKSRNIAIIVIYH